MTHSATDEAVNYDPETGMYRMTFNSATVRPSQAVLDVMATARKTDPGQLPPLYNVIETDALDRLLTTAGRPARVNDRKVTFTYHNYRVTIKSYGVVEARPLIEMDED